MFDGFGATTYIYNPYTFEQLRGMLVGRMDTYLRCISRLSQVCFFVLSIDKVRSKQNKAKKVDAN